MGGSEKLVFENDEENNEDEALIKMSTRKKSTIYEQFQRYGDCPQFESDELDSICDEIKKNHILSQRNMCPTDAYGVMEFTGAFRRTRAKYVRLADTTPIDKLLELFREEWALQTWPKLLISVVGGGGRFSLGKSLETNLRQGLCKVALNTDSWFLTGGTDNDAIRFIGSIFEGDTYKDVKVIGVVPWGIVAGRSSLKLKVELSEESPPKIYPPQQTQPSEKEFYLNRNHSHFVLVDTGKVGLLYEELKFRSQMERKIIDKQIEQQHKSIASPTGSNNDQPHRKFIPAIQIVINGGSRIIETVANTLQVEQNEDATMPVLVVAGSGRAADLLAFAYELTESHNNFNQLGGSYEHNLMNKIEDLYPGQSHEENVQTLSFLMKCMKKKKHITIYDSCHEDACVDEAILTALMRVNNGDDEEEDKDYNNLSYSSALDWYTIARLNLTLLWNRADIAQKEIFEKNTGKQHEPLLEDLMMSALSENKRSFVELLLENGFDMTSFNYERLAKLYCENYEPLFFCFIGNRKRDDFSHNPDDVLRCVYEAFVKLSGIDLTPFYLKPGVTGKEKLRHPLNELFLWAVLCNKHNLALCLWNSGKDVLAKALIARKLYLQMKYYYRVNHMSAEEELLKKLQENANEFDQLALGLLNNCSSADKQATKQLLSQKLANWGDQTCMSLAASSEFKEFIAHPSCQEIVMKKWRGSLVFRGRRSSYKVIFGLFFLPIILWYKFKDLKVKEQEQENVLSNFRLGMKKIRLFFNAPITKFWLGVFSFIIFLYLFGYVLLTPSFPVFPSIVEWCVVGYILNFTVEEIRQVLSSRGMFFHQKFYAWWLKFGNKLDVFAIVLFYIGFSMRTFRNQAVLEGGRIVYALDLMVWILRLSEVFLLHRRLGPYVVMICRMLFDVFYFIIIASVFLLSYGIARYAILMPSGQSSVHEILIIPYFQIFGEMFLDETMGNTLSTTKKYGAHSDGVVLTIMAIYLLLTNILLVNLLIAVFNNTYSTVQLHSERVCKWRWYCLVEEYSTHTSFVPPFVFIYYIIDVLRSLLRRYCCSHEEHKSIQRDTTDASFQLTIFEEECQRNYLMLKEDALHDTEKKRGSRIEETLTIIDEKIGKLDKRLTRVEELVQTSIPEYRKTRIKPDQRMKAAVTGENESPRESMKRRSKILHDDLSSGKSLRKLKHDESVGEQQGAPHLELHKDLSCSRVLDESHDEQQIHVLSRSRCYPYSNVRRFTFDDKYVNWKVVYEEYHPIHYTSLSVQVNFSWADSEQTNPQEVLKYNTIDGNVDRRSFLGDYDVINGLPRNPIGRTGLTGRGCLGRYGPNHIVEPIITRKRRDGSVHSDCFEVLVILKQSGDYELPSDSVNVDKKLPNFLKRLFSKNTLEQIGVTEKKHSLIKNMEKVFDEGNSKKIHEGYMDDVKNTDHSWVESSAIHYHDIEGALNKFFICERFVKLLQLHWVDLNTSLPDHQISYLEEVKELLAKTVI